MFSQVEDQKATRQPIMMPSRISDNVRKTRHDLVDLLRGTIGVVGKHQLLLNSIFAICRACNVLINRTFQFSTEKLESQDLQSSGVDFRMVISADT